MEDKYKEILKSAKERLANMDTDEFLDKFLKIQDNNKEKSMSDTKDYAERVVKVDEIVNEIVNPYLIYEMAIGGGCTEEQAKVEMMLYCKEVGLNPLCP